MFRSVSASKYTFMEEVPRLLDTELMYNIPGTPFTAFSIGVVTVLATTSEFAPLYLAFIDTAGGAISGKSATGKENRDKRPSNTKNKEMTNESIGRCINSFNIVEKIMKSSSAY